MCWLFLPSCVHATWIISTLFLLHPPLMAQSSTKQKLSQEQTHLLNQAETYYREKNIWNCR